MYTKIHVKQIINNIVMFIIFLYSSFHSDVFVIRANSVTIYEWNQSVKRGEKKTGVDFSHLKILLIIFAYLSWHIFYQQKMKTG